MAPEKEKISSLIMKARLTGERAERPKALNWPGPVRPDRRGMIHFYINPQTNVKRYMQLQLF